MYAPLFSISRALINEKILRNKLSNEKHYFSKEGF